MKLGILVKPLALACAFCISALASAEEIPASPAWLHDKLEMERDATPSAKIVVYRQTRGANIQYFISVTKAYPSQNISDLQSLLLNQDGKELCTFGGIADVKPSACHEAYKPAKGDKVVWMQSGGKMKPGGVDHVPTRPASGA